MKKFRIAFILLIVSLLVSQNAFSVTKLDINLNKTEFYSTLIDYQDKLDYIKGRVSKTTNDTQLNNLHERARKLSSETKNLLVALESAQDKLKIQLDILGPDSSTDDNSLLQQRAQLNEKTEIVDDFVMNVKTLHLDIENLIRRVDSLRQDLFKNQLTLNTGSVFNKQFWSPIVYLQNEDQLRLADFYNNLYFAWAFSWREGQRMGTVVGILSVSIIWIFGRFFSDKLIIWFSERYLPDGRLRRSFASLGIALTTTAATGIALNLLYWTFSHIQPLPSILLDFSGGFIQLGILCALFSGLGRAFLFVRRPSWRLVLLDNGVAYGMRFIPSLLAFLGLVLGSLELANNIIGMSVRTIILGNGVVAIILALVLLSIPLHSRGIRRRSKQLGIPSEKRSPMMGLLYIIVFITSLLVLFALIIGYIPFARFLTYQLIWGMLVLAATYFLISFFADLSEAIFLLKTPCREMLQRTLNIKEHHLEQSAIISTAIFKSLLLFLMFLALINGSFGATTFETLIEKTMIVMSGKGESEFHIALNKVSYASIVFLTSLYVFNRIHRWLSDELLPKMLDDIGIRLSLTTLFRNVGYVLNMLITLSALGLEWNNLAWIVSALSVGIGFGLQEIVKNFISGLILLTERPVKVGDLIDIGGVEGDVRRISVRTTEVQLSDRSTMIIPNSQLISQNVRNATMGDVQGIVTIMLTFPININVDAIYDILLSVFKDCEDILDSPTPYVRLSQLNPAGIVISITGYVVSPRVVGAVKSDLLFNIFNALRQEKVKLSIPREFIFTQMAAEK